MRIQGEPYALLALAAIDRRRYFRIERNFASNGKPNNVVELHAQVRYLQLRGQQLLFRLEELRTALDEIHFECAAILDLLHALRLDFFNRSDLCLDGAMLRLDDQKLVVKLAHSQ